MNVASTPSFVMTPPVVAVPAVFTSTLLEMPSADALVSFTDNLMFCAPFAPMWNTLSLKSPFKSFCVLNSVSVEIRVTSSFN